MADIKNITIDGTTYDLKDAKAREDVSDIKEDINLMNGDYFIIPEINGWIDGEYIKLDDGTVGTLATYHRTDYIEINPILGEIHFTNVDSGGYDTKYNAFYDVNKVFIKSFQTVRNGTIAIQPPLNARYMRLSFNKTTVNTISVDYASQSEILASSFSGNRNLRKIRLTSDDFTQGVWFGPLNPSLVTNRIRTNRPFPVSAGDIIWFNTDDQYIAVKITDTTFTSNVYESLWTGTSGCIVSPVNGYVLINVCKPLGDIVPSELDIDITLPEYSNKEFEDNTEKVVMWHGLSDYIRSKFITHMSHSGSGTYIPYGGRNAIISPMRFDFDIAVTVKTGYMLAVQYYDGFEIGQNHLIYAGAWVSNENSAGSMTIPAGTYFCMIVAHTDNSETDSTTQNNLTFYGVSNANDVYGKLLPMYEEYIQSRIPSNYIVGSDLMKRPVNVVEVGTLTYPQSFCIYNGNFYSVDGDNISVQDSTFTETDSAVLGTGHGNGLQLGSNGKAYASGWNDQKIYVVDLETLTIDDTITLPTTGYTTCVVDEVRDYAYIFQRDSYPDHEDNYNFIVYDITNSQIISTRKILAFGAMQAADLFDDRIIVLNGLGGSGCPNGYRVFDLNGNILADYFFGDFVNQEPEGVCIDRDTKEMYISMVSKKCYKVTM